MDYDKVLSAAYSAVLEQKGRPVILDLRELTVVTDYF